jgi:hypothetical protein
LVEGALQGYSLQNEPQPQTCGAGRLTSGLGGHGGLGDGGFSFFNVLVVLVHLKLLKHLRLIFIFSHFSSKPLSGKKLRMFETDELLLVVAFTSIESVKQAFRTSDNL